MTYTITSSKSVSRTLRCLVPLICFTTTLLSYDKDHANTPAPTSSLRATAILRLDKIPQNATGTLSIQDDALLFQPSEGPGARIPIRSIQSVFLNQQDKQVGGTTMAVGRAATPFGGGRVIGLLAHKKYDFLTLEYLDANGGFHGAVWQLNQGQGESLRSQLEANGAHIGALKNETASTQETKNETK